MIQVKLLIFSCLIYFTLAEEFQCTINGKKALNRVDEKFISISVDPAILLSGINISDASAKLAKHLSPAYLRIAGPSSKFIKYSEDEIIPRDVTNKNISTIYVTPSLWASAMSWVSNANLKLVFGINDYDRINGGWNPKNMLPLFHLSDKFNFNCIFQLGFDPSNKTASIYVDDLLTLGHILDAFPEKKSSWGIVGSDLSNLQLSTIEDRKNLINGLRDVLQAVMWEPGTVGKCPLLLNNRNIFNVNKKPKVPVWTSMEKENKPVTFLSALEWAESLGQAASLGYEVIFRKPRLHELFSETAVFWTSFFHKQLMGRNILELRYNGVSSYKSKIFAHCTKRQNRFPQKGAATILIINKGETDEIYNIKIPNTQLKNLEVQTYSLTSNPEFPTTTYINGRKLSLENLDNADQLLVPTIRRTNNKHINLTAPSMSISFYVLPSIKLPLCVEAEEENQLLPEVITKEQNLEFPKRKNFLKKFDINTPVEKSDPTSIKVIYENLRQELKLDQNFYGTLKKDAPVTIEANYDKSLKEIVGSPMNKTGQSSDMRVQFLDKVKNLDKSRKNNFLNINRSILSNAIKTDRIITASVNTTTELPSKSKAGVDSVDDVSIKFAGLTSTEIEDIIELAKLALENDKLEYTINENNVRPKRDLSKIKDYFKQNKEKWLNYKQKFRSSRPKRAINMDLLEEEEGKTERKNAQARENENTEDQTVEEVDKKPKTEVDKMLDNIAKFMESTQKLAEPPKIPKFNLKDLFTKKPDTYSSSTSKTIIVQPNVDDSDKEEVPVVEYDDDFEDLTAGDDSPYHEFQEDFGEQFKVFGDNKVDDALKKKNIDVGNAQSTLGSIMKFADDIDALLSEDKAIYNQGHAMEIPYGYMDSLEDKMDPTRYKRQTPDLKLAESIVDTVFKGINNPMSITNTTLLRNTPVGLDYFLRLGQRSHDISDPRKSPNISRQPEDLNTEQVKVVPPASIVHPEKDIPATKVAESIVDTVFQGINNPLTIHKSSLLRPTNEENPIVVTPVNVDYFLSLGRRIEESNKKHVDTLEENNETFETFQDQEAQRKKRELCDLNSNEIYTIKRQQLQDLHKNKERFMRKRRHHSEKFLRGNKIVKRNAKEDSSEDLQDITNSIPKENKSLKNSQNRIDTVIKLKDDHTDLINKEQMLYTHDSFTNTNIKKTNEEILKNKLDDNKHVENKIRNNNKKETITTKLIVDEKYEMSTFTFDDSTTKSSDYETTAAIKNTDILSGTTEYIDVKITTSNRKSIFENVIQYLKDISNKLADQLKKYLDI